ncbi:uncharacterized protein LOC105683883 [Athalia rosae]|uniref:uncharacterized protein LOC105683883 n=1 Tax=Athalia rosae TaxID=37344 RepID=UPI002033C378|nr:uncharacterized protein LOC105683883 [Athalia rosae]XP_048514602.1 uncharacterized protein LOC105683883 [Athalia rosae]
MKATQFLVVAGAVCLAFTEGHLTPYREDTSDGKNIIEDRATEAYRLPNTLSPEKYTITLTPYIYEGNFTFDGTVNIAINVIETTNNIYLHAKNLVIESVQVTLANSSSVLDTVVVLNNATDVLHIILGKPLAAGSTVNLEIGYTGILAIDMTGFYRSSYTDVNGNLKWIATTQFQPTYARQAFPCFDEPAFKAKFNIRINRPQDLHAISNMPIANESALSDGRVQVVFDETPVMSTYLVAFIVSDFESLTTPAQNFTVWARPNAIEQARYALSVGPQVLEYYTEITGHDYPLPKMEMAALSDFDWGAMENWGLVTYRETAMLYDENHSSATAKARVATVVAHELAHMWFGNIITLAWWDYAWLNEGFARRFQYLATDVVEPTWKMRDQFLVEQHQVVFGNDALESAHALVTPVSTSSQISSHFSTITYNKGASIIRMIENILGESVWHEALHEYIKAHSYGNVEPDDLWAAIQTQVDSYRINLGGQTAKTVFDTWVLQAGYPVLNVNINNTTRVASISQERFLLRRTENSVSNQTWWIPVNFVEDASPDFSNTSVNQWMGTTTADIQLSARFDSWVLFNVQEYGYYRVNYDDASWAKIIELLNSANFETIHVLNRAQIIDDILNLARADYVSYETALAATKYLKQEKNYIPWKSLFTGLDYISRRLLGNTHLQKLYEHHILSLIEDIYNELGFDDIPGEDWLNTLNRRQILDWACNFGNRDCQSKALEYFAKFKASPSKNTVPPNQRTAVYCTAIKYGTSDDWHFLWNQYALANVAADKIVILEALGCSRDYKILYGYLHFLLEEERGIRLQDMSTVYSSVYSYGGLLGVAATLDFISDHYSDIESYYGSLSYVQSILSGAASRLSSQELLDKYTRITTAHADDFSSISNGLSSQLTLAQYEQKWSSDHFDDVYKWLSNEHSAAIDYRLPTTIYPSRYEVHLFPHLVEGNFTFDGTVRIFANVVKPTNEVVLQYNEITVHSLSVDVSPETAEILSTSYDQTTHKYTILLSAILPAGTSITIHITYVGTLNDDMEGFYRSSYVNEDGETRWLAATQFESTYARQAFPCFDEPSFKAKFIINLRRPSNYTSVSNMPLANSSVPQDGYVWDTFEESVSMSSYLVAFLVSDFSKSTNNTQTFSIWTRPEAVSQAAYALDFGPRVLTYLEDLFGIEYKLPKMDMAAIPDFSSGAMENWGLVTYRETAVLYDETHSSASAQQRTSPVVSHELLHMWFGNLVSPKWWNVLWLSEAFARYYQYFATAVLEPSWNFDQQFVVDQLQSVFTSDALESAIPMTNDVSTPSQISNNFGSFSYAKGASIVRMTENFLGTGIFIAALRNYLEARQYSTATQKDLWKALQEQVDRSNLQLDGSIEDILTTWTEQAGYPVINVAYADGNVTFSQERFLLRKTNTSVTNITWWVPITWTDSSRSNFSDRSVKYWLSEESATIPITDYIPEWIILNIQEIGYYRVNYDKRMWYQIFDLLQNETSSRDIHELNRAAIVDDLLNLARAGYVDYETALDGLQFLTNEFEYLPWKAAFNALEYLNRRFAGYSVESLYENYILAILDKVYDYVGFVEQAEDSRLKILLRNDVLSWTCKLGHTNCVSRSLKYFADWRANETTLIPKNIRPAVYCTAIRHGTPEDWQFLYREYYRSNVAAEQTVILAALGCSRDKNVLESYLRLATSGFNSSRIRLQDSTSVFSSVYASSLHGLRVALDYVMENYETMHEYYGDYDSISSILSGISLRLSTPKLVEKFESLIEIHGTNLSSIKNSLDSYLTQAKWELNWYGENAPNIIKWLNRNYPDTSATTDYRLPTDIVPKTYELWLKPWITVGNFTFDGIAAIEAIVVTATNKVVLHIDEITWTDIKITSDGTELDIADVTYTPAYHFLVITLDTNVTAGSALDIWIEYWGFLNTAMRGFYRSSYVNDAGVTRWLAATHLEPTGARKTFPCFDEPALKAKFTIHVNRPEDYHVISNMPLNNSSNVENGRVWDTFKQSVTMSTYLVAVIVSDFANLTNEEAAFGVYARPNAISQAAYALSIGPPLVANLEGLLDYEYQLPKLDMVALPDFVSGAMENWGLLTYKETRMLVDETHTSTADKQVIGNVISHEITHQWFGNLVSPEWWKYVWLNEGFARYYQYQGNANVETSWGLESQFVVEQLQVSFASDGLTSTHPMSSDVWSPTQIRGIFDTISYAKAASVLRMMHKTFGDTLFHQALHNYLKARQFNFATPEHLWEAFQGQINASTTVLATSVKSIMDTWTTQSGFPVLNVTITSGVATFDQERFYLRNTNNASKNQTWWIPITWATQSSPQFNNTIPKYWLGEKSGTFALNVDSDEWVIFNVQESGYYRVNYDAASWGRIIAALKADTRDQIHELNRAAIMDDLFNLARAGYVRWKTVLDATLYLSNETSYIPWRSTFNGLTYLNRRFAGTPSYNLYKRHILSILDTLYNNLGFSDIDGEVHYNTLLREYVLRWACNFEHEGCIRTSQSLFAAWRANPTSARVPVNQRSAVYCTAIKHGTSEDWYFLWDQYKRTNVATEHIVILSALGCSENTTILHDYLYFGITPFPESGIRSQDSKTVFSSVYSAGLVGAEYVLDFVEEHYDDMYAYYEESSSIASILSGAALRFSTQELVDKFESVINRSATNGTGLSAITSSLHSYLNLAKYELNWFAVNSPAIIKWLSAIYTLDSDYRLPTDILPESYEIHLTPILEMDNFVFVGEVEIVMNVVNETSVIVLHAAHLTIKNISVYSNAAALTGFVYTCDSITQKLTIFFGNSFPVGTSLKVYIEYTGILNDQMEGFYRSSYTAADGTTHWIAATQFQPTHARSAFPCFDEPSFKARFTVNIATTIGQHALSNMPLSNTVWIEGVKWESFEQTVPMSSYLLAFIVSDFESIENEAGNFKVWARPNAVANGEYALFAGQGALAFLANYTGVAYPLPKMDMAAISDFAAGAMENWGLVTFREYGLLSNVNVTSVTYERYITTIVSHELVHMWFGNLVTCDWWNFTWMNEGFAQYYQYVAGDAIEPSANLLQQFVVYALHEALESDASNSTHPMNNDVSTPSEISDGFDTIAYEKSASVIRMMQHSFGPTLFANALHNYLEENQYGTTHPDKLWSAIQTQVDLEYVPGNLSQPVKTVMDTWASHSGYPVVNVTLTSGVLKLAQERFLLTRSANSATNHTFWIPVTYATRSNPDFRSTSPKLWFGESSTTIDLNPGDDWIILNVQEVGFYRVNYDTVLWSRLIDTLRSDAFATIHEINRAQIIDDLLNLARSGYVDYSLALDATLYLKRESNHLPFRAFFSGVDYLSRRFDGQSIKTLFDKHVLAIIENVYGSIGLTDVENEGQLNELNRQLIVFSACNYGHQGCVRQAQTLFDAWRADPDVAWIPPNIRSAVYCTAIKYGGDAEWQFLWDRYTKTNYGSEQVVILNALGCSRNATTLQAYLFSAIQTDQGIRRQDSSAVFSSVYGAGRFGLEQTLEFLINNYNEIFTYSESWSDVASVFSAVATRLATEEQIEKLEKFISANPELASEDLTGLASYATAARTNFKWYETNSIAINAWLEREYEMSTTTTTGTPTTTPEDMATTTEGTGGGAATATINILLIGMVCLLTLSLDRFPNL